MNEKQTNPERPKVYMTDKCNDCDKTYKVTADNGELHTFDQDDDKCYVLCNCTHCNFQTTIFISPVNSEKVRASGVPEVITESVDDSELKNWLEVNGCKMVETYELTNRHEESIAKLALTLSVMPADDVMEEFMLPQPPQALPQRWI